MHSLDFCRAKFRNAIYRFLDFIKKAHFLFSHVQYRRVGHSRAQKTVDMWQYVLRFPGTKIVIITFRLVWKSSCVILITWDLLRFVKKFCLSINNQINHKLCHTFFDPYCYLLYYRDFDDDVAKPFVLSLFRPLNSLKML